MPRRAATAARRFPVVLHLVAPVTAGASNHSEAARVGRGGLRASDAAKRVLDPDAVVVTPVVEFIGQDGLAAHQACRLDDRGVRVWDPEAL